MKLGRPGRRSRPNPNYDCPNVDGMSVPPLAKVRLPKKGLIQHQEPHYSNMNLGRPGGRSRPNQNYDYLNVEGRSVPS